MYLHAVLERVLKIFTSLLHKVFFKAPLSAGWMCSLELILNTSPFWDTVAGQLMVLDLFEHLQ